MKPTKVFAWKPFFMWKEIDPPTGCEPSDDTRYYQRVIKLPYSHWSDNVRAIVNRWIEANSWVDHHERCGHTHDCCGCQIAQSARWTYSFGKLTLNVTQHFNY